MLVILQEAAKVHRDERALLRGMEEHDTCWWAFQTLQGPRRVQQNLLQAAVGTCASRVTTVSYPLSHDRKTLGKQESHFSNKILPIPCCFSRDGSLTVRRLIDPPLLRPRF